MINFSEGAGSEKSFKEPLAEQSVPAALLQNLGIRFEKGHAIDKQVGTIMIISNSQDFSNVVDRQISADG